MDHPDFVMSMYAKKEDLYKAKATYYQAECERLEGVIEDIAAHTVCDTCYAWEKAVAALEGHKEAR